ncbi:MAG: hypothetical protein ACP5RS_05255 [Thermoplasmata archaeon]
MDIHLLVTTTSIKTAILNELKIYALFLIIIGIVFDFFGKIAIKALVAIAGLIGGAGIGYLILHSAHVTNVLYIAGGIVLAALIGLALGLALLHWSVAMMGAIAFAWIAMQILGVKSYTSLIAMLFSQNIIVLYVFIAGIIGYIIFTIYYDDILIILTLILGGFLVYLGLLLINTTTLLSITLSIVFVVMGGIFQYIKDKKNDNKKSNKNYSKST